jgi:hypothetical protein
MPDKKLDSPLDPASIAALPASLDEASMTDIEAESKKPGFSNDLLGTWVNVDPDATGIVKIVVTRRLTGGQEKLTVQPFIGSLGRPHDLGSHSAVMYGDEVSPNEPRAFSVTLSEFLSKTLLTGHFEFWPPMDCVRREKLVVEAYTQGFRHRNYYSRDVFRRA